MRPVDLVKAMFAPVTEFTVLIPLILFAILATVGMSGGPMGILLLVLLLPPVFRFQMLMLEASAKGIAPEPLDAENFSFAGAGWALFPLPLVVFTTWAAVAAGQRYGPGSELLVLLIAALLLPASLAVLAITRAPLQSLNPLAIGRLLKVSGDTFWIAPIYLLIIGWLCLNLDGLPLLVINFLQLVLTFSFFSLTGFLIEPYGLMDDVFIPDAVEPGREARLEDVGRKRDAALGHAYVFITRDNRKGGFDHLFTELKNDPDPAAAWAWYFDRMLRWDNPQHALFFGQHYVRDALAHGESIVALKVTMRCRLVDERFKPFPDDVAAVIAAAEKSGNTELATVLKRG